MRRRLGALLVVLVASFAPAGLGHVAAGASVNPTGWRPTDVRKCPEVSDALTRLYAAYFLRNPDEGGWEYWADRWSSGQTDLVWMSEYFAASPEFQARYGGLADEAFVDLVYRNVLDRPADAEGAQYWEARLASGFTRGELMVLFAESPEFTERTGTTPSAAGPFNWFPAGSVIMCNEGPMFWDLPSPRIGDVRARIIVEADPGPGGFNYVAVRTVGIPVSQGVSATEPSTAEHPSWPMGAVEVVDREIVLTATRPGAVSRGVIIGVLRYARVAIIVYP